MQVASIEVMMSETCAPFSVLKNCEFLRPLTINLMLLSHSLLSTTAPGGGMAVSTQTVIVAIKVRHGSTQVAVRFHRATLCGLCLAPLSDPGHQWQ